MYITSCIKQLRRGLSNLN